MIIKAIQAVGLCVLAIAAGRPGVAAPLDDPIPEAIEFGDIEVQVELVTTGMVSPLHATFAPGDTTRLFVADQIGILYAVDLASGNATNILDLTGRTLLNVGSYDERGFLGVAFHPDYQNNGRLFTYTSEAVDGAADFPWAGGVDHQSVIAEWRVANPGDPTDVIDPTSRREVLRIDEPTRFHNGGSLAFDNDGYLLIALGNGGPLASGLDPSNPLGSILRIDVDGSNAANGAYGIPSTNPFVGMAGVVEEIFAIGFRNPFRISVDSVTGDIYAGDVGNNDIEEVNFVVPGNNYGFNRMEGSFCFVGTGGPPDGSPGVADRSECDTTGLTDPLAEYDHDEGVAVIGGYVYHGADVGVLADLYVYGDYNGRLFYLDGTTIRELRLFGQPVPAMRLAGVRLLGMGEDADGEIYGLTNRSGLTRGTDGTVYRVVSGPGRVEFSSDSYRIIESGSSATITVTRGGGDNGQTRVSYATVDDTAGAGDYTAVSGELVWMDGEDGDKTFDVPIRRDGKAEGTEILILTLTSVAGAPVGAVDVATLTIVDPQSSADVVGSVSSALLVALLGLGLWRRRRMRA